MKTEAKYQGTLQLKELAEHHLANCIEKKRLEKAAIWTETVQYFDRELRKLRRELRALPQS